MATLSVKKIIHRTSKRGEFFTIVWADDTKTTVKRMEGDESDEYTAFLFCLGKRIFKDRGKAREFIRAKKQVFELECEQKSIANKQRKVMLNSIPKEGVLLPVEVTAISPEAFHQVLTSSGIFRRNQ